MFKESTWTLLCGANVCSEWCLFMFLLELPGLPELPVLTILLAEVIDFADLVLELEERMESLPDRLGECECLGQLFGRVSSSW